jgi:hypothetical protein
MYKYVFNTTQNAALEGVGVRREQTHLGEPARGCTRKLEEEQPSLQSVEEDTYKSAMQMEM